MENNSIEIDYMYMNWFFIETKCCRIRKLKWKGPGGARSLSVGQWVNGNTVALIEVLIQWFLDPHLPQIDDKFGWFIRGLKKSSRSQEPLEPPLTAPL